MVGVARDDPHHRPVEGPVIAPHPDRFLLDDETPGAVETGQGAGYGNILGSAALGKYPPVCARDQGDSAEEGDDIGADIVEGGPDRNEPHDRPVNLVLAQQHSALVTVSAAAANSCTVGLPRRRLAATVATGSRSRTPSVRTVIMRTRASPPAASFTWTSAPLKASSSRILASGIPKPGPVAAGPSLGNCRRCRAGSLSTFTMRAP